MNVKLTTSGINKNPIWKGKYVQENNFHRIFKKIHKRVELITSNRSQPNEEFLLIRVQTNLREMEKEFYSMLNCEFQNLVKTILIIYYNRVALNFVKIQINFDFLETNKLNLDPIFFMDSQIQLKHSVEAFYQFTTSFRTFIHSNFRILFHLNRTFVELLTPTRILSTHKKVQFNRNLPTKQVWSEIKELDRVIAAVARSYSKK